jgi:hypothetical protein
MALLPPRIDPALDRWTWRDRRGRRGDDLRRVFAWLERRDDAQTWWDAVTIADEVGLPLRRAISAVNALVREYAVERSVRLGTWRYRIITW